MGFYGLLRREGGAFFVPRWGKRWHARCSDCQRSHRARPGDSPPTKPMFPCCSPVRMTHYTPEQSRDACAQPRTDSLSPHVTAHHKKVHTHTHHPARDGKIYNAEKVTAANLTFSWSHQSAATLLFRKLFQLIGKSFLLSVSGSLYI